MLSSKNEKALDELRDVLQLADWVKFAKYEANVGETDRSILHALDFINNTHQEQPVNPKPVVKEVLLKPKKQILVRRGFMALWILSIVGGVVLVVFVVSEICNSFF